MCSINDFIDYKVMVDKINYLPLAFKVQEYLKIISAMKSDDKALKYVDSKRINNDKLLNKRR